MKTITFNLNESVRVQLTHAGRQFLHAEHHNFWDKQGAGIVRDYTPPKEDAEGWSTWQLHSLMSTFGCMIILGRGAKDLPFALDIQIDVSGQTC